METPEGNNIVPTLTKEEEFGKKVTARLMELSEADRILAMQNIDNIFDYKIFLLDQSSSPERTLGIGHPFPIASQSGDSSKAKKAKKRKRSKLLAK